MWGFAPSRHSAQRAAASTGEFFRLNEDKEGLGPKGDYVALEDEHAPRRRLHPGPDQTMPTAWTATRIWADMVCYDELGQAEKLDLPHHYCVYAGRRDCHTYKHSHEEILARYGRQMKMCDRVPDVLFAGHGRPDVCCHPGYRHRARCVCALCAGAGPCTGGKGLISAAFYFLIIYFDP